MKRVVVALMTLLAAAIPMQAAARTRVCTSVDSLVSDATFRAYPASSESGRWRSPDVSRGEAHAYRTVLRAEGTGPPDFAGHFRVVRIGCGAGSFCPAFVDRSTGHVTFAPELRVISWMPGDPVGPDRLVYRRDSRLLIVLAVRNENEHTAGATLYDWVGGRFRLLRFIPRSRLCSAQGTR
jgi:hypothetical protein